MPENKKKNVDGSKRRKVSLPGLLYTKAADSKARKEMKSTVPAKPKKCVPVRSKKSESGISSPIKATPSKATPPKSAPEKAPAKKVKSTKPIAPKKANLPPKASSKKTQPAKAEQKKKPVPAKKPTEKKPIAKKEQPVKTEQKKKPVPAKKPTEKKPVAKKEQPAKPEQKKKPVPAKKTTEKKPVDKKEQPVKAEQKKKPAPDKKPTEKKPVDKKEQPVKAEQKKKKSAPDKKPTEEKPVDKKEQPVKAEQKKKKSVPDKKPTEEKPVADQTPSKTTLPPVDPTLDFDDDFEEIPEEPPLTPEEIEKYRRLLQKDDGRLIWKSRSLQDQSLVRFDDDRREELGGDDIARTTELRKASMSEDSSKQIQISLRKMEEGTYGKCQCCGKQIPRGRLDAHPQALYCIFCQESIEEEEKRTNFTNRNNE